MQSMINILARVMVGLCKRNSFLEEVEKVLPGISENFPEENMGDIILDAVGFPEEVDSREWIIFALLHFFQKERTLESCEALLKELIEAAIKETEWQKKRELLEKERNAYFDEAVILSELDKSAYSQG